jgi:hypothetical protein
MTVKEFTKKYFDSLCIRFPNAKFTIVDDSTIDSKFKDLNIRSSVDNAYREYQSEPDSLPTILNKYLSTLNEIFNPPYKINTNKIVPIIKPIEYLNDIADQVKGMGAKKDVEDVYEKYNDQLIIVYAENTKNNIKYLTQDDIKSLSLNRDSLKPIAIRNLRTHPGNRFRSNPSACPCVLKIEAAGNAVHIHHFSCKK